MQKYKWIPFFFSIIINILLVILLISPFITIQDSFKDKYLDSTKTTILVLHHWNSNTNFLIATDDEIFDYINKNTFIDYNKIDNNEYPQINISNNSLYKYVSQPFYSQQQNALYILSGNFNSDDDNTFYITDWHELDSKTLLGQTTLYGGGGIMSIACLIALIFILPSVILSIFIFIRTRKK